MDQDFSMQRNMKISLYEHVSKIIDVLQSIWMTRLLTCSNHLTLENFNKKNSTKTEIVGVSDLIDQVILIRSF